MSGEYLVPLTEVSEVTGRTVLAVRAECVELGMTVRADWAGRDAISVNNAKALFSGQARRAQEHALAWAAHLRAVEDWKAGRDAAVKAGAKEAQEKEERRAMRRGAIPGVGGPLSPGEASAVRHEGAMHAGAQYERMNSRPSFNGSREAVKLAYITPDDEGSLIASAVGALRGAAKNKAPSGIEVE
jgi:hypothetical protein